MNSTFIKRRRPAFGDTEAGAPSEAAWLRAWATAHFAEADTVDPEGVEAAVTAAAAAAGVDLIRGLRALGYRGLGDFIADEIDAREP